MRAPIRPNHNYLWLLLWLLLWLKQTNKQKLSISIIGKSGGETFCVYPKKSYMLLEFIIAFDYAHLYENYGYYVNRWGGERMEYAELTL